MRALFVIWQCIWGLPQTLIGAVLFLANLRRPHYTHRGAIVTEWSRGGGISLGLFVFVGRGELVPHEYGHCIQSLILGALYLPVIGLPSLVWAGAFRGYRRARSIPYERFYTERWAEFLSESRRK